MNIFKSIKWRLQIWYGFFLVLVLLAFGSTSYQLERDRQHRLLVENFNSHLRSIIDSMQRPPPFPEHVPGEPLPNGHPPRGLHLSSRTTELLNEAGTMSFYYVIWSPDGKELMRSTNAPPDITMPVHPGGEQMRGVFREFTAPVPGPRPEYIVLVGRSIAPELKELHQAAVKLTAVGAIYLFCGLLGGWLFIRHSLRPISEISSTAAKISAGDLSQRINVAEAESELGKLASVLNSTFARLEAAFAQQQQFTSDAAHELRTPLTVMLTQTQTVLNRERAAGEYKEALESCQRAAQRMRKLMESLLELARLDAGQEQMKRMRFDLSETTRDCIELIRPLADEQGVKIHSDLSPLECVGDSERMAQVINNLLTNAIQYNKPNGEVRVSAKLQNGIGVLTVADTGIGISAADLPRVFERFYRVDKSRSSAHTGLGLAISKAIVEAHSGTIEVSSEENVGTTFTVRLPAS